MEADLGCCIPSPDRSQGVSLVCEGLYPYIVYWMDGQGCGGRRMREAESVPGSAPVALARYVPLSRLRPRELGHRARMSGQCGLCRLDGHEAAIAREVGCERDL